MIYFPRFAVQNNICTRQTSGFAIETASVLKPHLSAQRNLEQDHSHVWDPPADDWPGKGGGE